MGYHDAGYERRMSFVAAPFFVKLVVAMGVSVFDVVRTRESIFVRRGAVMLRCIPNHVEDDGYEVYLQIHADIVWRCPLTSAEMDDMAVVRRTAAAAVRHERRREVAVARGCAA